MIFDCGVSAALVQSHSHMCRVLSVLLLGQSRLRSRPTAGGAARQKKLHFACFSFSMPCELCWLLLHA